MKVSHTIFELFLLVFGVCLLLMSCNKFEDTGSIYDPNSVNNANTVEITQVIPEIAGSASEITIRGTGFTPGIQNNWVYFISFDFISENKYDVKSIQATIKSVTENEIVVFRPKITSDSIQIKVVSSGVMGYGIYHKNYPMKSIIDNFGVLLPTSKATNICIDKDDNAYVLLLTTQEIIKLTSTGKEDSAFVPVTGSTVEFALDIKEGPGDYIYFLRKSGSRTTIYRFTKTGGTVESYQRVNAVVESFDYDTNGNMYLGGRDGVIVLKSDLTEVNTDIYDDFLINTVRVYNNELYVLGIYNGLDSLNNPSGIYKSTIISGDGQLGPRSLILDWELTGDYQDAFFNSFTISEFGEIYVATDYTDPILYIGTTGEVSKLYYGLLSPEANHLMWGGGEYLYVLMNAGLTAGEGNKIVRINMGKNGAPYHGREL